MEWCTSPLSPLSVFVFEAEEKVEGEVLQEWLNSVVAPVELAAFIRGEALLTAE